LRSKSRTASTLVSCGVILLALALGAAPLRRRTAY
jgi:hypothetical protein